MEQLARPSVFVARLSRLFGKTFTLSQIHEAINSGNVEPYAMAGTTPLFRPNQFFEIGAVLTNTPFKDFRHQVRSLREAAPIMRTTVQALGDIIEAGDVPFVEIDGVVHIHMPTVSGILRGGK